MIARSVIHDLRDQSAQSQKASPHGGAFLASGGDTMRCPNDHLSGADAARDFGFSRAWCNTQRYLGKLAQQPCGHYRYRDIQKREAETRASGMVLRGDRAQLRAA